MSQIPWETVTFPGLSLPVLRSEPIACPYLPDRLATPVFLLTDVAGAGAYQQMMNLGFRRSGHIVYGNHCRDCRECVPIRVSVADFQPSRTQRRVWRRNLDLEIRIAPPICDEERLELYRRYQWEVHQSSAPVTPRDYEQFLVASDGYTLEMSYRLAGRLVAVGIVDACPSCLSSVYCYYDPGHARRSLGIFSALREIEECRVHRLRHWYSGYYVRGSPKMTYKTDFRPHEFLHEDGRWRAVHPFAQPEGQAPADSRPQRLGAT